MGKIYDNILETIGHTPIVRLHRIEKEYNLKAKLFAKVDFFNPGGSIKDRMALGMVEAAEREGLLKEGGMIIEGSSGNTGIGLALVGAAKGYKVKICMPENMSHERVVLLKAFGADVYLTPSNQSMAGGAKKTDELLQQYPDAFSPRQGKNPNNPGSHYKTTGPEIWDDMDGNVDILVAASGTGGTISGTGRYLKEKKPDIKIVAVEPLGSPLLNGGVHGPHKIQGIGGGATPETTDTSLFDEVIDVSDDDAYFFARLSPKKEGILIGISAGAALYAAVEVAKREENKDKNIVVIFPDGGDHYLSSDLFEY
jgi:cysteine synthase A